MSSGAAKWYLRCADTQHSTNNVLLTPALYYRHTQSAIDSIGILATSGIFTLHRGRTLVVIIVPSK